MRCCSVCVIATLSLAIACVRGQTNPTDPAESFDRTDAPTSQPALPPGHPPMPGGLPAGHPTIPSQTPVGPVDPAKMGGQPLPAGHPTIPAKPPAGAGQPATSGATLDLFVKQGTAGGPTITSGTPVLELYHEDKLFASMPTPLESDGHVHVYDVPTDHTYVPLLKMTYAGVEYEIVGDAIDRDHLQQELALTVYETTQTAPAWKISMRHLMAQAIDGKLEINDVIVMDTPGDRVFLPTAGAPSFSLPLPSGASDVHVMGGLNGDKMTFANGQLVQPAALQPGQVQYQIAYTLPIQQKAATIAMVTPVAQQSVAVLLPDDASVATVTGLASAGVTDMGTGVRARLYKATNIAANTPITIALSNLAVATPEPTPTTPKDPSSNNATPTTAPATAPAAVQTPLDLKANPRRFAIVGLVAVAVIGLIFASTRRSGVKTSDGPAR